MPPRKPKHLKALHGTLRGDREKDFPHPAPRIGDPPRGLPREGKRFWENYASRLEELGLISALDRPALERLCVLHALLKGAEQEILASGLVVDDKKGSIKRHPAAMIYLSLIKEYTAFLKSFGMVPAARQKLETVTEERIWTEEDEFIERLLNRGRQEF
jgi:P27 family predicted phage terminase small subunit